METENIVILVTGASSGIGQAIAKTLAKDPRNIVYGTSIKAADYFSDSRVHMLQMDVTDEQSVASAVEKLIEKEKQIHVLVNCAGFGISGSVESVPVDIAQKQFEVNFFGVVRVIQKVLPFMRAQGRGTIINIGSVAGYISIPFQSMYSASKYALESLSEALRMELAPFNIHVCLVEPGDTRTNFTKSRLKAGKEEIEALYEPASTHAVSVMEEDEQNGYPPEEVAFIVEKIIRKKKPPMRTNVGIEYKLIYILNRILPTGLKLKVLMKKYTGKVAKNLKD
jgi:short-subunit dehydrogenase